MIADGWSSNLPAHCPQMATQWISRVAAGAYDEWRVCSDLLLPALWRRHINGDTLSAIDTARLQFTNDPCLSATESFQAWGPLSTTRHFERDGSKPGRTGSWTDVLHNWCAGSNCCCYSSDRNTIVLVRKCTEQKTIGRALFLDNNALRVAVSGDDVRWVFYASNYLMFGDSSFRM